VKRTLIRSNALVSDAKRLVKKRPDVADDLRVALQLLSEDALHPKLRTHKLKGDLEGSWAASAGYDLRIVSQMVDYKGSETILLQTVGPTMKYTEGPTAFVWSTQDTFLPRDVGENLIPPGSTERRPQGGYRRAHRTT